MPVAVVDKERSDRVRLAVGPVRKRDGQTAQVRFAPVDAGPASLSGPVRFDPHWRGDVTLGHQLHATTANAEAPPGGAPDPRELSGRHPLSGARVVTLTPATAEASGLDPFADGVFIQALDTRGVAARIGFRPGDIIDEVNGAPIRDAAQLDRTMAQSRTWVIAVERNGQRAELRF